jgi:hypothetical protein
MVTESHGSQADSRVAMGTCQSGFFIINYSLNFYNQIPEGVVMRKEFKGDFL